MIKGVIFDIDGTLLDTMPYWANTGARYLESIGVKPEPNLGRILFDKSLEEAVQYMKAHYGLSQTPQEIRAGVLAQIEQIFSEKAPFKPGAREMLDFLTEKGIPLVIATADDARLIKKALDRLGVTDRFGRIFTSDELNTSKHEPLIYETAARWMGAEPGETVVFEDILLAVRTAKSAGFVTMGCRDAASAADWEAIRAEASLALDAFELVPFRALTGL